MALRDELKEFLDNELRKTDPGLRGIVEGRPVELDTLEKSMFPFQYTRLILEAVYKLADEVDALRAELNER